MLIQASEMNEESIEFLKFLKTIVIIIMFTNILITPNITCKYFYLYIVD
jgi:hypothetical protein